MNTILANWKTIIVGLLIASGFGYIADTVANLSTIEGGNLPGLANTIGNLRGFSLYVGAHIAVITIGLGIVWPTVSRFDLRAKPDATHADPGMQTSMRDSFSLAWAKISSAKRLDIFVKVFLGELIAASLCFAA